MVARTITGNMARARKLADLVLSNQGVVTADATVDKFGSVEACRSVVRGIQTSFSSMRSVDRDREANKVMGAGLSNKELWVKSRYDNVQCSIRPLPDGRGWRAEFSYVDTGIEDLAITMGDGTTPLDMNRDMDAVLTACSTDITAVDPAAVIECGLHYNTALADIPNEFAGPMACMQGPAAEAWMVETFLPAWKEAMASAGQDGGQGQQNNSPVAGQET